MAEVFPFRGYRYNTEKIKDISSVVTQPYDKITSALQEKYYAEHEKNVVRIILGKKETGDGEVDNQYTRARAYLGEWIGEGTFVKEKEPAIYAYFQEYTLPNGMRKTRRGFVAMCRLMDYAEGGVKPHEKTLAGPKADRLNLLRATQSNFGQIFMLYSDPELAIDDILDEAAKNPPVADAFVGETERHSLWPITDPEKIAVIRNVMKDRPVFIADGHHRYETALNYRDEMRRAGAKCEGAESFENRMMTFVNMDDEGLTIFPTHRLIFDVPGFDGKKLVGQLEDLFSIREFAFDEESENSVRREFLEDLRIEGMSGRCLGLFITGEKRYLLLTFSDGKHIEELIAEDRPKEWKELDVNILHILVLERLLGIGAEQLEAQSNVHYERSADSAIDKVKAGDYQITFLMNPTKVAQVKAVAAAGERMPQKSTDFFPKLLTGMVFTKLNIIADRD
ncbi:MAG: DUF1015 domain-containing protein [Planctomycetota bacterium]